MANYCCTIRSNYFHVKNMDLFKDIMSKVQGNEDEVKLWEEKDTNGAPVFAFGCYSTINGIPDTSGNGDEDDIDENAYDRFIDALQKCVSNDDAIIVMESGHEQLRYVVGSALIITSEEIKYFNVADLAVKETAKMIRENFTTRIDY